MTKVSAHCPKCGKTVAAFTLLTDNELLALDDNSEVELMHTLVDTSTGMGEDHRWRVRGQIAANARKAAKHAASSN
jgi:hypothetical protein